jgi:phage/plasmid-like protein (TIGR03299 family)
LSQRNALPDDGRQSQPTTNKESIMAHNITSSDTLVLAGTRAWHGLGQVLPSTFTPDQALAAGYLNWDVHLVPIQTMPLVGGAQDGARVTLPDHRAVVRSDNGAVLGVVGDRYTPVQNREVFEMIRDGVAAVTDAPVRIESCGSFKGGAISFVCAHTHVFDAGNGDIVRTYAMFGNSHDGSAAFSCLNTSVRVVCNNTYNMALREAGNNAHKVRHTRSVHLKIERIARELVLGVETARAFEAQVVQLNRTKPKTSDVQEIYERAYIAAVGKPDDERAKRKAQATVSEWQSKLYNSKNAVADGSLWGIFNSITEWTDHERTVRNDNSERRMHANIYGDAAEFKAKVMSALVAV